MKRKDIAQETLKIQTRGFYQYNGAKIDIAVLQRLSETNSTLVTPDEGRRIIQTIKPPTQGPFASYIVANQSTVQAVLDMRAHQPAVLNFASAKNPGGGFLNGAMAQEESLAASSGLYNTLLLHEAYYDANRACGTMMYTDHAIYSPDVVFFRDADFNLLNEPVTASVLTLPAVNMGQVVLKGEDVAQAKAVMLDRMRLCLALFAKQQNRVLVLGAYGCGVFRNEAQDVAKGWKTLLEDEGYGRFFTKIVFAVLDRAKIQSNLSVFTEMFAARTI